ncbi:hypothetical protein ACRRTK_009972 [Alexandromys fortis]
MERLARSQKPWCLYSKKERKEIIENMRPALIYWYRNYPEKMRKLLGNMEQRIKNYIDGKLNTGPWELVSHGRM